MKKEHYMYIWELQKVWSSDNLTQSKVEGRPPKNAEINILQNTTEYFKTKIFTFLGSISEVLVGLSAGISLLEKLHGNSDSTGVAANISKQRRVTNV